MNDDRIAAGQGFGTHGHKDMEIVTYVLEGELAHKDSMGNGSVIRPGDVQRMSAGTGVMHSEFNNSQDHTTHLLQIWIEPATRGIAPGYEEKKFSPANKRGCLRLIASPDGEDDSVMLHQSVKIYAGIFDGDESATMSIAEGHRAYLHVARGRIEANGYTLEEGDALKFTQEKEVRLREGLDAEVLLFDMV